MKLCDLHTHSVFSDGTFSPKEIINSAIDAGLTSVALCDHNTADGLNEFINAAKGKDIEAIPGVEFSVDYNGTELHLLALYIPEDMFCKVADLMKTVNERKRQSNIELIASLNRAGYNIDYETIKKSTPNGKFNRVHIAAQLTKQGYTKSVKEAFDTLLSPKSGYYKEPERLLFSDMIDFIISINAIPVLAHPFLNMNREELEKFLPIAKSQGLSGMECYYSLYDEKTTQAALELADKYNLKYSGGSDFHGNNKPNISLGSGKGNLKIPQEWAIILKSDKNN